MCVRVLGGVSVVGKSAQINHGSVGRGRDQTELCCQHMSAGALRHAEHVANLPPHVAACVECVWWQTVP